MYSKPQKLLFFLTYLTTSFLHFNDNNNHHLVSAFSFASVRDEFSGANRNMNEPNPNSNQRKRIVLIRHGCTYMNEYLSKPGCQWGAPGFTDIFPFAPQEENEENEAKRKYRDSPLSPLGVRQAQNLSRRLQLQLQDTTNNKNKKKNAGETKQMQIMDEIDLLVVSPLTRALQTTELGLLPNMKKNDDNNNNCDIPIIALPYAAERLYLISDVGMSTDKLAKRFPWADFQSEFKTPETQEKWWFSVNDGEDSGDNRKQYYNIKNQTKLYKEWRPRSQRQTYAHLGEPEDYFENRMKNLID